MVYLLDKVDNESMDMTDAKYSQAPAIFINNMDKFTTAAARDLEQQKRQLVLDVKKKADEGSLADSIATVGDVLLTFGGIKTSLMTDINDQLHGHTGMFKAMNYKADAALMTTGSQITLKPDEEASMISILEALLHDDSELYSKLLRLIHIEQIIEPKDFVTEGNKILGMVH